MLFFIELRTKRSVKTNFEPMSLNKNIFQSILTHVFPAIVALLTIPFILKNLGDEKYGLITIFWSLLGMASLFELGLSRILTKEIAKQGSINSFYSSKLIKISICLVLTLMSFVLLIALYYKSELVLFYFKKSVLTEEIEYSVFWLLLAMPTIIILQVFKSSYEGILLFKKANLLQVLNSSINYFIPLVVSFFSSSISTVFFVFFVCRWIATFYVGFLFSKQYGTTWLKVSISLADLKNMLSLGFWFMCLAILNPFLIYLDRLVVGYHLDLRQVGYYATAFEIATRLWLIPTAITRITFSFFANQQGQWTLETKKYFLNSFKWLIVCMLLVSAVLYCFGPHIIAIWLNKNFAAEITQVLNIILVGIFFNSINWLILSYLQLTPTFSLSVKLVVLQSLVYIIMLGPIVDTYGPIGAAYLWSTRLIVDFIVSSFLFLNSIRR